MPLCFCEWGESRWEESREIQRIALNLSNKRAKTPKSFQRSTILTESNGDGPKVLINHVSIIIIVLTGHYLHKKYSNFQKDKVENEDLLFAWAKTKTCFQRVAAKWVGILHEREEARMELYRVIPLRENLWAISEVGKTVMYVVNGEKKALLLDTGFGMVPLRQVASQLCGEKPLLVVNSHGHLDHNSGNNQFDSVYVGRYDEPDSHEPVTEAVKERISKDFYQEFLDAGGTLPPWNPGPAPHIATVKEGDVFDLGGIVLEVLECPGHSLGSIALFERKLGWLFTGDLILTWEVWGQLPRSSTLRVYGESLRKLADLEKQVTTVFPAHWEEKRNPLKLLECQLPPQVLSLYAEGTEKIVRGEDQGVPYPFRGMDARCSYFEIGGMVFDPMRIG